MSRIIKAFSSIASDIEELHSLRLSHLNTSLTAGFGSDLQGGSLAYQNNSSLLPACSGMITAITNRVYF